MAPGPRPLRLCRGVARLRPALPAALIVAGLALLPYPTCLIRLAFGVPCPGCGMTRAVVAAAHLDIGSALRLHPLSLPLIALSAVTVVVAFVADDAVWRRYLPAIMGIAGVALVVVWALRFAGLLGGPVPV